MATAATPLARPAPRPDVDPAAVLSALPEPVLVVDGAGVVRYVNLEAQEFFGAGDALLVGARLAEFVPDDSPVAALIRQVRATGSAMREYDVGLATPRIGSRVVTVRAAPLGDPSDRIVVSLHEDSIARRIDGQLAHRSAARSVTAMAAMLAHEVKNPLSGIRGAAQLLEDVVPEADRMLTRLICDETDRIVALVDRMEVFSDRRPLERGPVNIHAVLEHVRRVAQSGFARHVRFVERYDPSLPEVDGNRDQLVQVFLNLVKNAAEAIAGTGGEIVLSTAYQAGMRLAVPGAETRTRLPLLVSVQDDGPGIPEDLRPHLFDAFVTTKVGGTGLGLALVAKIVGDHGGVIDVESVPRRTVFRVALPMSAATAPGA